LRVAHSGLVAGETQAALSALLSPQGEQSVAAAVAHFRNELEKSLFQISREQAYASRPGCVLSTHFGGAGTCCGTLLRERPGTNTRQKCAAEIKLASASRSWLWSLQVGLAALGACPVLVSRLGREAEAAPGDAGLLHRRFVKDAHLKLAKDSVRLDGGRAEVAIRAEFHLERASAVTASIVDLLAMEDPSRVSKKTAELNLSLLLVKCEVLFDLEKNALALERATEAAALNAVLPDRSAEVGVLAYNCGIKVWKKAAFCVLCFESESVWRLQEHRAKRTDSCISWLQLSVQCFDRHKAASSLSRSLRMLAGCFLERQDLESAKRAASLALEVDTTVLSLAMVAKTQMAVRPLSLSLSLSLMTVLPRVERLSQASDSAGLESTLNRLLQAPDLKELGPVLNLCRELRSCSQLQLALWTLKQLEARFVSDPALGQARLEHLLLLLLMESDAASQVLAPVAWSNSTYTRTHSHSPTHSHTIACAGRLIHERVQHAPKYAETVVSEHLSGALRLSVAVSTELMRVCFNTGVAQLRDERRPAAIAWVGYALALCPAHTPDDASARAQFHRVLSSIYLVCLALFVLPFSSLTFV
jgi:hypothetical protein